MSVLITGGGGGLARAVAAGAASRGIAVALVDLSERLAAEAAGEIADLGVRSAGLACDITDSVAVGRVWRELEDRVGTITAVVNCAGTYTPRALSEITPEDWARTLAANLTGPFFVCQRAGREWSPREPPERSSTSPPPPRSRPASTRRPTTERQRPVWSG